MAGHVAEKTIVGLDGPPQALLDPEQVAGQRLEGDLVDE